MDEPGLEKLQKSGNHRTKATFRLPLSEGTVKKKPRSFAAGPFFLLKGQRQKKR